MIATDFTSRPLMPIASAFVVAGIHDLLDHA